MNSLRLALFNLRQRLLSAVLTGFLVAMGVGLVAAVLVIQRQVDSAFGRRLGKFDLLVGPKGSALQLTLNVCFHIDRAVWRMPEEVWAKISSDSRVRAAWPFVTGDNFRGFHVVGTTPEFLTGFEYAQGEHFKASAGSAVFAKDLEAVIGSAVAAETGLRVGDKFAASHGLGGHAHEDRLFTVVGVLSETFTPHDRAVFCSLVSVWEMPDHGVIEHDDDDHAHHDHDHKHEPKPAAKDGKDAESATPSAAPAATATSRPLTGMLVLLKSPQHMGTFRKEVNDGKEAMAVIPDTVLRDLRDITEPAAQAMTGVCLMVLLSAGVSILLALYNSMAERRRDIAIIRALGGSPGFVMRTILLEAAIICAAGAVVGLAASYGLLWAFTEDLEEMMKIPLRLGLPGWEEAALLAGAVVLGVAAALLPAVLGYRTDVITNLRPVS
jgi:putative ABC transport system permease protein